MSIPPILETVRPSPSILAIAAIGVLAGSSALERWLHFRRTRALVGPLLTAISRRLRAGDLAGARELCRTDPSAPGRLALALLDAAPAPRRELEAAAEASADEILAEMDRGLRVLRGAATLSPLVAIGCVGVTLVPIIRGGATDGRIAAAIAEATLAAGLGLLVAVAATWAHRACVRRVRVRRVQMGEVLRALAPSLPGAPPAASPTDAPPITPTAPAVHPLVAPSAPPLVRTGSELRRAS